MSVWFVEVPMTGGGWSPQLHHGDRPSSKGSEGARRRFRAEPVEVRHEHVGLSLDELQAIYRGDISEAAPPSEADEIAEYMQHWEDRATKAEHKARLMGIALRTITYLNGSGSPCVGIIGDEPLNDVLPAEVIEVLRDLHSKEGG
jgi:hypothetical protein